MRYKSTRGGVSNIGFKEAFLMGLASDGGLIVPEYIPKADLSRLENLSYKEIAFEIFRLFIDDIDADDIKKLINDSYVNFDTEEITPLVREDDLYILELFHGPTLLSKMWLYSFLAIYSSLY